MKKIILLFLAIHLIKASNAQTKDTAKYYEREFQLSFITPLGTNGTQSFKTVNKFSVNILAGGSRGVNGIEVGSLANLVLKDVKGVQAAGFANVVLGNVNGAQFAGNTNFSGGNFQGGAFAGFCNVNLKKFRGAQFAGFANANLDSLTGAQFSGFCNFNGKHLKGAQSAGFLNVNIGNLTGAQLSGFANVNIGDVKGAQISGFINYARKVKGLQLGFINIADSVSGASLGFFSFVRKGLHEVEISGNELLYANASFRTGTHSFYNIFSIGATTGSKDLLWAPGYGIGTSFKISEKLRSDVTLSEHHVSVNQFYSATSELFKLYWGVQYKLGNKCNIAAGPTFNLYLTDALLPEYTSTYNKIAPYSMFNTTSSDGYNLTGWIGGKIAIRFL